MNINILCFASSQDATGHRELTLNCPEGSTVRDALAYLIAEYPDLSRLAPRLRFALGAEFVEDGAPISEGSTLALLPPMSGG